MLWTISGWNLSHRQTRVTILGLTPLKWNNNVLWITSASLLTWSASQVHEQICKLHWWPSCETIDPHIGWKEICTHFKAYNLTFCQVSTLGVTRQLVKLVIRHDGFIHMGWMSNFTSDFHSAPGFVLIMARWSPWLPARSTSLRVRLYCALHTSLTHDHWRPHGNAYRAIFPHPFKMKPDLSRSL